ncbi:MAG: HlyD family efflux transporter periplasmic adaptor subunit, partial [Sphingobium sp.]
REEVLDAASQRLHGSVVLASPAYLRLVVAVIFVTAMLAAFIVALTPLARRATVAGSLVPTGGLVRIAAEAGGVIDAVHVTEGDDVLGRQPVVTFRSTTAIRGQDSFETVSALLEAGQDADTDRFSSRSAALEQEQRSLIERGQLVLASLEQAEARRLVQADQMTLAQDSLDRAELIAAKGFLPRSDLDGRKNAILALRLSATDLRERILSLRREQLEISARLETIPLEQKAVRAEATSTRTQSALQDVNLRQVSAFSITAPVAGRLTAVPARPGASVSAGDALAYLIPRGNRLNAELLVPSRAIGLIEEGQPVRIKYQAFPHQRFGVALGTVRMISRSPIPPAELGVAQTDPSEPMFRVIVDLKTQDIGVGDRRLSLMPGALLQADIEVERTSMFERLRSAATSRGAL